MFLTFFFFFVTSLANSSNLALFSSCCFARQDGRLFKLWNVSRCGRVNMTDGGCYLEAPVGCEGIVKEVELKASNIHLVHLQWGFNFTYDIHVWLLKFTCVFLVMPKPMNLSSNWGVSALATYRGSYLKMYFSTLSLKVSNHMWWVVSWYLTCMLCQALEPALVLPTSSNHLTSGWWSRAPGGTAVPASSPPSPAVLSCCGEAWHTSRNCSPIKNI